MNLRIKKLISWFAAFSLDAYLVTKDVNIRYLTGFPASESWLLVTPKKSYYITDSRYVLEAQKSLKGIPVKRYTASMSKTLFDLMKALKLRALGLDEHHVSLALYRNLKKYRPKNVQLKTVNSLVENLREIKDTHEIGQIRKALKVHLEAYDFLKGVIKPGVSEQQVFQKLEQFVKAKGVAFSFDPIIASGPNSCLPHAKITTRKIRNNESVLVDIGIDMGGYKSDLTRIFFLGKIPHLVREIYQTVSVAQKKAIAKIQAGVKVSAVDEQARNYLKSKSLSRFFGHSLGHGVGLEIHEAPRLASSNPAILKENMVVTVEPAVYLPNKFGIRIEDMVLVTREGCEVLSGV